jgi:uroporphyrinogen decarboxylase
MGKLRVPLRKPKPDREEFLRAVTTDYEPKRPRLIEYIFNDPLMKGVLGLLGREWVTPGADRASRETWCDNFIAFWHHMGYDFVRLEMSLAFPLIASRFSVETGRDFAETTRGPIGSWPDFEKYPWPDLDDAHFMPYEYISTHLPEGMGFIANHAGGMYEYLSRLMGYETLCVALYEEPALVGAICENLGRRMITYYERILELPNLIAIFPGDDMGFRTGTLISPNDLRKYTLPWHRKFAAMAHAAGKKYFLHSCGNVEQIMPDLIEDVRIDAKHSFEDAIMPVAEFKRRYGARIGVLGGLDVDKLTRLTPHELRRYVRGIIDECAPGGHFAIGSGNSIPDYIPIENYLTFVDEALR